MITKYVYRYKKWAKLQCTQLIAETINVCMCVGVNARLHEMMCKLWLFIVNIIYSVII